MVVPTLGFLKVDKKGMFQPHDDALVVTIQIGGYDMKRALVDQGNGAEIIYSDLYKKLCPRIWKSMIYHKWPLMGGW